MILGLHISIALSSVVLTTITFFKPNYKALAGSTVLVAFTIISGTLLVITQPATLVQACISGLVYTAVVSVLLVSTNRKLASTNKTI